MTKLDHVGMSAFDYEASLLFYTAALRPLGLRPVIDFNSDEGRVTGFAAEEAPFFWVGDGGAQGGRLHVAFEAGTRAEVDAFHHAAVSNGGRCNGAPGVRSHYHEHYYAAFVLDLDGNNIEAVCHASLDA